MDTTEFYIILKMGSKILNNYNFNKNIVKIIER